MGKKAPSTDLESTDLPTVTSVEDIVGKINTFENTKKLKPVLKKLIEHLQTATEVQAITVLLKSTDLTKYKPFPVLTLELTKALCKIWATHPESQAKIVAFLALVKIPRFSPSLLPKLIKLAYFHYQSNSKQSNVHTLTNIAFLKTSLIELLSIDTAVSYNIAFISIRYLAIQLKNATSLKSKETRKLIYGWPALHSMQLWADFLSCTKVEPLNQLIYPLTQIILGAISLNPTPKYFPFHAHMLQTLNTLGQKTNTYIPLYTQVLTILQSSLLTNPKPSTLKPLTLETIIKFPKEYCGTITCARQVFDRSMQIIYTQIEQKLYEPGLPEMMIPLFCQLKKMGKCRIMKDDVTMFLGMLGKHCKEVKKVRSGFDGAETGKCVVESELVSYILANKKMDAYLEREGTQ